MATTILYVEDDPINVLLIQRILDLRPTVHLLVANDGAAGIDMAAVRQPDLILLDLHLPDMGGEKVLQLLQADPETRDIPVVVISADVMPADASRLRSAGAVDYLTKPFDLEQFLTLIDTVTATAYATIGAETRRETPDLRIRALITSLTDAHRPS
jgi:CheY-like chemotaxis protein